MQLNKTSAIMLLWLALPLLLLLGDYSQQKLMEAAGPTPVTPADAPMVEIPAGEFIMGLTIEEAWQLNRRWRNLPSLVLTDPFTREIPQLTVYLNTFFIDKFEVSNAQYRRCVTAGKCRPADTTWKSLPENYANEPIYDDHPALGVRWPDAEAYCRWADKRLPTEAEWEKAARGADGRLYPWGNHWQPQAANQPQAKPTAVGSSPMDVSPYGAFDLAGNAPEWTASVFQTYPQNPRAELYSPLAIAQPRIARGFAFSELLTILAVRTIVFANERIRPIGFRCAQGPPPPPLAKSVRAIHSISGPEPAGPVDLKRMVHVPAGEFIMGSDDPEAYARRNDETPAHVVYLDAFYIDKYEVTVTEFVAFLNALGGHIWRCDGYHCIWGRGDDGQFAQPGIFLTDGRYQVSPGGDTIPITYIRWGTANAYCRWAGKRLPSEAEWEKAARGVDGRKYPWGNEWRPEHAASFQGLAPGAYPFPVGSHPRDVSPYGAFDMMGNADEWVNDWYAPNYYRRSPNENPRGPEERQFHVNRGVSSPSAIHGITVRRGGRSPFIGFRCAYTPAQQ